MKIALNSVWKIVEESPILFFVNFKKLLNCRIVLLKVCESRSSYIIGFCLLTFLD